MGKAESVKDLFEKLTDEERVEIMQEYCTSCGKLNGVRPCQCWNDE